MVPRRGLLPEFANPAGQTALTAPPPSLRCALPLQGAGWALPLYRRQRGLWHQGPLQRRPRILRPKHPGHHHVLECAQLRAHPAARQQRRPAARGLRLRRGSCHGGHGDHPRGGEHVGAAGQCCWAVEQLQGAPLPPNTLHANHAPAALVGQLTCGPRSFFPSPLRRSRRCATAGAMSPRFTSPQICTRRSCGADWACLHSCVPSPDAS